MRSEYIELSYFDLSFWSVGHKQYFFVCIYFWKNAFFLCQNSIDLYSIKSSQIKSALSSFAILYFPMIVDVTIFICIAEFAIRATLFDGLCLKQQSMFLEAAKSYTRSENIIFIQEKHRFYWFRAIWYPDFLIPVKILNRVTVRYISGLDPGLAKNPGSGDLYLERRETFKIL